LLRRAFRLGIPLMLSGLSIFVLNVSDRLVTQRLLGSVEVGRFQVAYTLGYVLVLILSFTNRAWIPRLAQIEDDTERWTLVRESRDGIFRLLMPAILGITLAGPVLLRVVAPPSFRPESLLIVVYLVAMAAFPVTAVGASARMLITLRMGRPLAWSAGGGVIVKLAMNLVLVPLIGIAGAALATLVAVTAQAVIQNRSLPRSLGPERPAWRLVALCILVSVAAAATVFLPQTLEWNIARFVVGLLCLPWFFTRLTELRRSGRPSATTGDPSPTDDGVDQPTALTTAHE
jgi:O-antigen/teichoic acid export membrane protein